MAGDSQAAQTAPPERTRIFLGESDVRRPVVRWQGQTMLGTRRHDGPGGARVCVAFAGEVGGPCACAIHPDRPGACRRFEAGSDGCRFARQEAGLPL